MKKRAKMCFYIFIICAIFALGILGYFILNNENENVMVGSRKFVTFKEVPNAVSYSISVKTAEEEPLASALKYFIEKKTTSDPNLNYFEIEVFDQTNQKVATETYTQLILSIDDKNETMDCIIKDYTVCFLNSEGEETLAHTFIDQTLRGIDIDTLCCVVSEYFDSVFTKDGVYKVVYAAIDEEDNEIESKEFEYKFFAYYEHDFLKREDFFMNGKWNDYVITSKEELKMLVWHTILFRNNDVTFFIKTKDITAGNINALVFNAIEKYPEYDALNSSNTFGKMQEKIGKLFNFNYYLEENFTKKYTDLLDDKKDEYTYNLALKHLCQKDNDYFADYITNSDTEDRHFFIEKTEEDDDDKKLYEIPVFNTEQLFMVVEYGAKPIFASDCVAKRVYENAISELEKINTSNSLTDYEKVLNIYRYLCNNVTYDYVTYEFMDIKSDFSIYNFGNYSCFYLEGVFYDLDNQYAVCDGISKAFVLLCRIEGIEAVKVNGEVKSYNDEFGNHAWNKVLVVDEVYGLDGWYYTDGTWGVATYSEKVFRKDLDGHFILDEEGNKVFDIYYYEIPTHTYFLVGPDDERIIHFESGKTESANDHDYYELNGYNFEDKEGNFLIESDDELIEAFDFIKYQLQTVSSKVLEIKISNDYDKQANTLIAEFRDLFSQKVSMAGWFESVGVSLNEFNCDSFNLDEVLIFRVYK